MKPMNNVDPEVWKRVVENYEQCRQNVVQYEVEPPGSPWIEGVDLDGIYPRDCYGRALEYTFHVSRMFAQHRLVHGETSLALGGHAWVELPNGLVFDGVYQRFYRSDDYYGDMAHATPWYIYEPDAAWLVDTHLEQPLAVWCATLKLPMICDRPPIHVTEKYAEELLDNYYIKSGESVLATLRKETLLDIAKRNEIKVSQRTLKADLIKLIVQSKKSAALV